jgi:hypothetical protein
MNIKYHHILHVLGFCLVAVPKELPFTIFGHCWLPCIVLFQLWQWCDCRNVVDCRLFVRLSDLCGSKI